MDGPKGKNVNDVASKESLICQEIGNRLLCVANISNLSSIKAKNMNDVTSKESKKVKRMHRHRRVSSVPFPFRFPFQLHCELVSSGISSQSVQNILN